MKEGTAIAAALAKGGGVISGLKGWRLLGVCAPVEAGAFAAAGVQRSRAEVLKELKVPPSIPPSPPPYNESSLIVNPIVSLKRRPDVFFRSGTLQGAPACAALLAAGSGCGQDGSNQHHTGCAAYLHGEIAYGRGGRCLPLREIQSPALLQGAHHEPCTDRPQSAASESIDSLLTAMRAPALRGRNAERSVVSGG